MRAGMAQQSSPLRRTYAIEHLVKTPRVVMEEIGRVDVDEPAQAVGAEVIRDVAMRMAHEVGDGSTTAIVLTESMFAGAMQALDANTDPKAMARGVAIGAREVCANLGKLARPVVGHRLESYGRFIGLEIDVPWAGIVASTRRWPDCAHKLQRLGVGPEDDPEDRQRWQAKFRALWLACHRGAVPGGGVGLWRSAEAMWSRLPDEPPGVLAGIELVYQACREPLYGIAENLHHIPARVERAVREAAGRSGYSADTGQIVGPRESDVVDPFPVLEAAVKMAASYTARLLRADVVATVDPAAPQASVVLSSGRGEAAAAKAVESLPPPAPKTRTVSTGFSEVSLPGRPCDANMPLRTAADYWFWLEIGEPVPGSIEQTPVDLRPLPPATQLRVILFAFPGHLELTPGQDTGVLIQGRDGGVTVDRQPVPGERLVSAADLAVRRLFFPVRTPGHPGEYQVRCHIYHGQTLLQARTVHALVSDTPARTDQALYSALDYTVSASLIPARLGRVRQPALNVLLNDNGDGSHTLRLCSTGQTSSAYFDGQELSGFIERIRWRLHEISWGDREPWNKDKTYRYKSPKTLEPLAADLAGLAETGWQVYCAIRDRLAGDLGVEELRRLLTAGTTVEIVHRRSARLYLPASMIYDDQFDADVKWTLCPDFAAAFKAPEPLGQAPCFTNGCRYRDANVLCPSGFWGYRHVLGFPLSLPERRDGGNSIKRGSERAFLAALALDLADVDKHMRKLETYGWGPARLVSRDEVLKAFKAFTHQPPLIYFYCHGGVNQDDVPFLRVGRAKEAPLKYGFVTGFDWKTVSPLVLLNGCRTTAMRPEQAFDMVTPFVRDAGASGVIGTEITIFESLAQDFASDFIDGFLKSQSVGAAVREARLNLLKKGNPLGLVYVPYAMYDLHLQEAA